MISLKAFLDKLAGPDHPFCKGAPVEETQMNPMKGEKETEAKAEATPELKLNKFLRTNSN